MNETPTPPTGGAASTDSADTDPVSAGGAKRGLTEPSPAAASVGADQVQATVDAEEDQGYHGVAPDPTPNHAYTVAGVLAGEPTPETDPAQAATAAAYSRHVTGPVVAAPSDSDPKGRKRG